MAVFVVNTGSEDTDTSNSTLSLREALILAEASAGADTIVFDAAVSLVTLASGGGPLVISSGAGVTIDGDRNGDGIADVSISGGGVTRILNVGSGAVATLQSVNLVDGADNGADGTNGANGTNGADGTIYSPPAGGSGTVGTNGTNGADVAGAIFNAGNLTLIRVGLAGNTGYAGDGGTGGNGGDGGDGRNTPQSGFQGGSLGGDGGNGGNGGTGGSGGYAAGAIFNAYGATLTLQDTGFGNIVATDGVATDHGFNTGRGGTGASGGQGGTGGAGGAGGESASEFFPGGDGGDAGQFGQNGGGGNAGSAAGAIFNRGTVIIASGAAVDEFGGGNEGFSGDAGIGGYNPVTSAPGGAGGLGAPLFGGATSGPGGSPGASSTNNPQGAAGQSGFGRPGVLANAPTGGTVADSIIYLHDSDLVIAEGDGGGTTAFTFNINRMGDLTEGTQVSWAITGSGGVSAADFGGVLPSGVVTFAGTEVTHQVTFTVQADALAEFDETFTITLSNLIDSPDGAIQGLGTSSVTGTILSDDGFFAVFADATSTVVLSESQIFAPADAAAATGQVIRVSNPAAFGNTAQNLTVTTEDLTVISGTPFAVRYTLAPGVIAFTEISPSTSAADAAVVVGNDAANVIRTGNGFNEISGGIGNDSLFGGANADQLFGGADNDQLNGGTGDDQLHGGIGNDIYFVDSAGDLIFELAGEGTADRVATNVSFTLAADDDIEVFTTTSSGGTTNLSLTGNALAQTITGNAGNNVLRSGTGASDTLRGLAGDDVYRVFNIGDVVEEAAGNGTDRVVTVVNYTLAAGISIENFTTDSTTGTTNLSLTGNALAQTITGNAGNNVLRSGTGAPDTLRGLAGDDTYRVFNTGDVVEEVAGNGTDRVVTVVNYTLAAGISIETFTTDSTTGMTNLSLTGNALAQTITGNAGNNVLRSGTGAPDTMRGLAGDDTYRVFNTGDVVAEAAGNGADRVVTVVNYTLAAGISIETFTTDSTAGSANLNLTGNEVAQTITGNAGVNVLDGKGGNDTITGGAGADDFVFSTALGAGNLDRITDFAVGVDDIVLLSSVFSAIGVSLTADEFRIGAAVDANDFILYDSATGALTYDSNGNAAGGATQFATLQTGLALTVGDFGII